MGRRLERHVDFDLAERILASGPINKNPVAKTKKTPRPGFTYRQNGRGRASTVDPWAATKESFKERPFSGRISLNRSDHWMPAKSYQHAREIGPSSEPVR